MSIRETGSSDLNCIIDQFNCPLKDSLDKHTHLCSRNIVVRDVTPWYNGNIKEAKVVRRKFERDWVKIGGKERYPALVKQKHFVNH